MGKLRRMIRPFRKCNKVKLPLLKLGNDLDLLIFFIPLSTDGSGWYHTLRVYSVCTAYIYMCNGKARVTRPIFCYICKVDGAICPMSAKIWRRNTVLGKYLDSKQKNGVCVCVCVCVCVWVCVWVCMCGFTKVGGELRNFFSDCMTLLWKIFRLGKIISVWGERTKVGKLEEALVTQSWALAIIFYFLYNKKYFFASSIKRIRLMVGYFNWPTQKLHIFIVRMAWKWLF